MRTLLLLLTASFAIAVNALPCAVSSGANTAALVELYTSEACPGCPEAQRRLSPLARRDGVVALAVAVDEPSAARDAWLRQRKLTPLQRLALVSRPEVLLQGREFRPWPSPAFDQALREIKARPARASLRLEIVAITSGSLTVRAQAASAVDGLILYLAAFEQAAEGALGQVLAWDGPLAISHAAAVEQRVLRLGPGVLVGRSGAAAFVQNRRDGEVLQTVMLPACP